MSRQWIKGLTPGQPVSGVYMVEKCQLESFSSKPGRYLSLVLRDKTGEIRGVLWEGAEEAFRVIREGEAIWIQGDVTTYRNTPQVTLKSYRLAARGEFDPSDFVSVYPGDLNSLITEFRKILGSVSSRPLKRLLKLFFESAEWWEPFVQCPAAKNMHHAYMGGLLEHTLSVMKLCERVSQVYPAIDRDLLLAGAALHDLGKVKEYSWNGLIDFTDSGRLLGHIVIGAQAVDEAAASIPEFPEELRLRVVHMILSHHGQYEWGSPKRPQTPEACVLHHADNMDAQIVKFLKLVEEAGSGRSWSAYDEKLERMVYLGSGSNWDDWNSGDLDEPGETGTGQV